MIDTKATVDLLADWIADQLHQSGRGGVVLGASGGIDSALVAALSRRALGGAAIRLYALPNSDSDPAFLTRAQELADSLDLPLQTIAVGPLVAAGEQLLPGLAGDPIRRGNLAARARMSVLYDQAREHQSLVIGTGNRSEALVGYTTLHGDAACDLAPIAGLYKDEIYTLARELALPDSIIKAAPSAGLWPGQSDEAELGLSYRELDPILRALADRRLTPSEASRELGVDIAVVGRVEQLMRESAFKRLPVPAGPSAIAR